MATRREIAEALKKASAYLFFRYRYSCYFEVGLKMWGARRADVIGNKINGQIVIVEVKSSVADFKNDNKFEEYLEYCDRFYVCFTQEVWNKVVANAKLKARINKRVGVIVLRSDGYAKIVKPSKNPQVKLETRLSILARLAWRNGELSKRKRRSRERVFIS